MEDLIEMWEQLLEIGKGGADQGGIRLYKGGTSDPLEAMTQETTKWPN